MKTHDVAWLVGAEAKSQAQVQFYLKCKLLLKNNTQKHIKNGEKKNKNTEPRARNRIYSSLRKVYWK